MERYALAPRYDTEESQTHWKKKTVSKVSNVMVFTIFLPIVFIVKYHGNGCIN